MHSFNNIVQILYQHLCVYLLLANQIECDVCQHEDAVLCGTVPIVLLTIVCNLYLLVALPLEHVVRDIIRNKADLVICLCLHLF